MQRIPLIILRLPFSDSNFILTFQHNKFNKKCSGQKSFALSIYGLSKMEKDIVGKNSNDIFPIMKIAQSKSMLQTIVIKYYMRLHHL